MILVKIALDSIAFNDHNSFHLKIEHFPDPSTTQLYNTLEYVMWQTSSMMINDCNLL